jgi:hypothetical protein
MDLYTSIATFIFGLIVGALLVEAKHRWYAAVAAKLSGKEKAEEITVLKLIAGIDDDFGRGMMILLLSVVFIVLPVIFSYCYFSGNAELELIGKYKLTRIGPPITNPQGASRLVPAEVAIKLLAAERGVFTEKPEAEKK